MIRASLQYEEVCREVTGGKPMMSSLADWPGGGCLESAEKFQAFGEKLMPLVQKTGLQPSEPIVYPAHNFVKE